MYMKTFTQLKELIGNAPLLDVSYIIDGSKVKLLLKLEVVNTGESTKSITAPAMIEDAEKKPGSSIVELINENARTGLEPASSAAITTDVAWPHKIQWRGTDFVLKTFIYEYVDNAITVTDDEAYEGARILAHKLVVLAGASSGLSYMGKTAKAIIDAIVTDSKITSKGLADLIRKSKDTIKYHLFTLQARKFIAHIGPDNGGS